jgi:hypothetical protein
MPKGVKSIETRHYEERDALFDGLGRLSRRAFFRVAGISAGIAAAKGLVTPRSFQLVEVANAQPRRAPRRSSRSPTSRTRTSTRTS